MSERINLTNPPQVPASANPQPGETGYVPPTELVPLPSRGVCYPVDHPFHGAETVEIRSMTAREEDILTSRALLKTGRVMSVLIKSCLVEKSVDPDMLLSGDRNAILSAIRITGYGPEYKVKLGCPSCDQEASTEVDISKFPVKRLDVDPVAVGQNAFSFVLPVSKKTVVFSLPTGLSEREVEAEQLGQRKALGPVAESNVTTRLFHHVASVGEETDRQKIKRIITTLPARDSLALRNYMEKISCGVEMVQAFECPSCGDRSEVDVPVGTEFFWPRA